MSGFGAAARRALGRRHVGRYRAASEARLDFALERGVDACRRRQLEIAQLPLVLWKGELLHTIRCQADFGKGPHDVNVPEVILWHLIHFERFRCPYHR